MTKEGRSLKEGWSLEKRERFEGRLASLGWDSALSPQAGCLAFFKGGLCIEIDDWGIWVWEAGKRRFGLADDLVDVRIFDHIGPLVSNPFGTVKRLWFLNLATAAWTTKKPTKIKVNREVE